MNQIQNRRSRPGTIKDMRQVCQHWTQDQDGKPVLAGSLYNRYVLRSVSIYVTWFFVAMGIRAHAATIMMTIAGILGIVLCVPHVIPLTIVGGLFLYLFDLLDAVDGEIARWNKSSSTKGLYLDQVSHVFIDAPSLGIAALHYYAWKGNDLYLVLAMTAIVSSVMSRLIREMFFRINAESLLEEKVVQASQCNSSGTAAMSQFVRLCSHLKSMPLATFPIVKQRVAHILTLVAIGLAYSGFESLLVGLSWFYAVYGPIRFLMEVPYYYSVRVIDATHKKKVEEYNWPI